VDTLGLIFAGDKSERTFLLTKMRSVSALPFASKYRLIDLTLSNMINSGITRVGILTQFNSRSLIDHLGNGREWDLDRRNGGMFILQPIITSSNSFWYRGTADAIFQNISLLKRSPEEYVVIGSGNHVYKYDYRILKNYHIQKDADITILMTQSRSSNYSLKLDENNRIINVLKEKNLYVPMEIYFMKKELLVDLLYSSIPQNKYELFENLIVENLKYLVLSYLLR
jgi:glucose-1-phosphate adenylyltransferase